MAPTVLAPATLPVDSPAERLTGSAATARGKDAPKSMVTGRKSMEIVRKNAVWTPTKLMWRLIALAEAESKADVWPKARSWTPRSKAVASCNRASNDAGFRIFPEKLRTMRDPRARPRR